MHFNPVCTSAGCVYFQLFIKFFFLLIVVAEKFAVK